MVKGLIYFWDTRKWLSPGVVIEMKTAQDFISAIRDAVKLADSHSEMESEPRTHRCAAALASLNYPNVSLESAPGDGGIGSAVSRMQNPGYGPIPPEDQGKHFGTILVDVDTNVHLVWNGVGFDTEGAVNLHQVRQVDLPDLRAEKVALV